MAIMKQIGESPSEIKKGGNIDTEESDIANAMIDEYKETLMKILRS